MTGDIKVTAVAANTNLAFKNCARFTRCLTHTNYEHVETAENVDIIMPMCNLIECSDNYEDSSGSLHQFKRDKSPMNDAENPLHVALDNSTSFKYKASLLGKATDADGNDAENPLNVALHNSTSFKHKASLLQKIRKIATAKGDDYTTGCLLDYQYFKDHY